MALFELGKNGQVLEWCEHLLSELLEQKQEAALVWEPVLHPAANWTGRQMMGVKCDHKGVYWEWDGWEQVAIVAYSGGRKLATLPSRTVGDKDGNFVPWKLPALPPDRSVLGYCDCLELTPQDKRKEVGITVRVERPLLGNESLASFRLLQTSGGRKLRVCLQEPEFQRLKMRVQVWQLGGDGYVLYGAESEFDQRGCLELRARNVRGLVAVVELIEGRARCLRVCQWFDAEHNTLRVVEDEAVLRELRDLIESRGTGSDDGEPPELLDWIRQWPQESATRLRQLYGRAIEFALPQTICRLLRENPTGLLRAVAVRPYVAPPDMSFEQFAAQLQAGNFWQSLRRLCPDLPESTVFSQAPVPVQDWLLRHAQSEGLAQALAWAGSHSEKALANALQLIQPRQELVTLLKQLNPATTFYLQAYELQREFEQSPLHDGQPQALMERLAALQESVARARPSPLRQ